ncbi:MAG: aminopeptidase P family protein [Fastidiosipilaceae bacterium]|jgi:Xaa-Pro aminopeptidase|nr:aminopeptidase P family protein [Clostridiaceae bacterium]
MTSNELGLPSVMVNRETLHNQLAERRAILYDQLLERNVSGLLLTSRENTRYLTGFTGTTSLTLISPEGSTILVDSRYIEQARNQCAAADLEVTLIQQNRKTELYKLIEGLKTQTIGIEDKDLTVSQHKELMQGIANLKVEGLSDLLANNRVCKDEIELALLKRAVAISDEAWTELIPWIRIGMSEMEIAGRLEYLMRKKGASGPSFDTIIGSGYRSALPHGVASEKKIEEGDVIVMDFGCQYQGYCSDITRTVFVGHIDEEMGNIYDIVLAAHNKAKEGIKAGIAGKAADGIARAVIEEAGYGEYFGHSLGHGIGLLIHEAPNFSPSFEGSIPAGSVLSVEPGIYLPGKGGVRIEDIGVVTESGYVTFTQASQEKVVIAAE